MKIYDNIYPIICSMGNLVIAWRKAKKGKTQRQDVINFEKNLEKNLFELYNELKDMSYRPLPLTTFVLRDPKTRVISKSDFRDRIVHHALINVIGKIFEKGFIYDSCANQKNKGGLFALRRFDEFKRKVTCNFTRSGFCFKADIKHYFQEINHEILMEMVCRKIKDEKVTQLIRRILNNTNFEIQKEKEIFDKGMPLGNLTSQFFANVYLNELDYFVKYKLMAKYYIRYVDDFVILHHSLKQLDIWKIEIEKFLNWRLKLSLHFNKSRIVSLYRVLDFIGFRNYKKWKLLRKRNIRNMKRKIELYRKGETNFGKVFDSYYGWEAYSIWADSYGLREEIKKEIINILIKKV